jgi:type III restriction enzyme
MNNKILGITYFSLLKDIRTHPRANVVRVVGTKLPDWFTIDTPLGSYNPDWAVLVEADGKEKLYFVVETKSTLFTDALRPSEKAKIACGKEHFRALGKDVEFAVTNSFEEFSVKYV